MGLGIDASDKKKLDAAIEDFQLQLAEIAAAKYAAVEKPHKRLGHFKWSFSCHEVAGFEDQYCFKSGQMVLHSTAIIYRLSGVIFAVNLDYWHCEFCIIHRSCFRNVTEISRYCVSDTGM